MSGEAATGTTRRVTLPAARTKLICTIGPASIERVAELAAAGMSVARINLAHGSSEDHERAAAAVRVAAAQVGREIGLLVDLPGPKIRLGQLAGGTAELRSGDRFELRTGDEPGDASGAPVTYRRLGAELQVGDRVFVADGQVELRVAEAGPPEEAGPVEAGATVITDVVRGGWIRSRSGVSVPSERLSPAGGRRRDAADARTAVALGADFAGQSFVRSADDIRSLRTRLGEDAPAIIAKIETRAAVEAIEEILDAADGVMVARGDLGVELPFEDVPLVQKRIVRLARERSVPVAVATQMLESMTESPRPTRAEATDVANAVFEGADAILLSAETAIGAYPVEAALAAVRILAAAEAGLAEDPPAGRPDSALGPLALADGLRPAVYVCHSESGATAARIAAARPGVPVVVLAADGHTLRQLALRHGVVPVPLGDGTGDEDLTPARLDALARGAGLVGRDLRLALVASVPAEES